MAEREKIAGRIAEHITVGVIASLFRRMKVAEVIAASGRWLGE